MVKVLCLRIMCLVKFEVEKIPQFMQNLIKFHSVVTIPIMSDKNGSENIHEGNHEA